MQKEKKEKLLVKLEPAQKQAVKKKVKKAVGKQLQKRAPHLLMMSDYIATIASPEEIYGMKIPDANTSLSFPIHFVQRYQLTASTAGAASNMVAIAMVVGSLGASSLGTGADFYIGSGGATAGAIVWNSVAKAYSAQLPNTQTVAIRPVSASLTFNYQGSTQTDQGRIVVCYVPGPSTGNLQFTPIATVSTLLNQSFVTDFPAQRRFGRVRYLPTDTFSLAYSMSGNGNFPYRTNAGTATGGVQYGVLYILADGLQAGNVGEFTLTENYECIPLSGFSNFFSPSVSKSDPLELSMVSNSLAAKPEFSVQQNPADMATATAVTSTVALSRPSVSTEANEPEKTFFERALDGVEKYGPLVARGAKLLGSLL
jgi:hypothetical protein